MILEACTYPSKELRRHVSEITDDPSVKDRILFSGRELLELRRAPDPLCHATERSPIEGCPDERIPGSVVLDCLVDGMTG